MKKHEEAIFENKIISIFDKEEDYSNENALTFNKLMAYYRCALMEIETKFNVLNEEYSLEFDRNPISSIKTRLKSPISIKEKLERNDFPVTTESIEQITRVFAIGFHRKCSQWHHIYTISFLQCVLAVCLEMVVALS